MQDQLNALIERIRQKSPQSNVETTRLSNGGTLINVSAVKLGGGWNRPEANVLFVAPPGYPSAAPDCFWVEPGQLRLANGATPQNTNDSNAIPGDSQQGRQTTWFSWHVQAWNPSTDTLLDFFQLILARLQPAR